MKLTKVKSLRRIGTYREAFKSAKIVATTAKLPDTVAGLDRLVRMLDLARVSAEVRNGLVQPVGLLIVGIEDTDSILTRILCSMEVVDLVVPLIGDNASRFNFLQAVKPDVFVENPDDQFKFLAPSEIAGLCKYHFPLREIQKLMEVHL